MNLSDFMGGPNGASTINIGSDTTLSMGNGSTQILVPSGAYTVTPPTDLGDSGMLLLYNDSEYNLKIMIDDPDYFTLVAGKVCRLFYGNSKWYVVTSNTKEPFHDIDPNNLNSNENVFNSGYTDYISVAVLTDTKFVVSYRDGGNNYYGTVIIGDVSGTTITFGSEYVFNSGSTTYTSVARLTDTKFVVAYADIGNNYYGTAIIGDVSGTTITFGSEYVFNSGTTTYISVARLTDTKFVVAYRDEGNSSYGTTIIGDVSGTTITFGSEYVFNSGSTYYISVARLTDTKFVVSYRDDGNSSYGTTIIGDVSGTTITFGSEYVFNSGITDYFSVAVLTDTKFVVSYRDSGNGNNGTAIIGDVSGTTITFGSEYVFNSGSTTYTSVARLTDTKFVVAYRDAGNSNYGTAALVWG